MKKTLVSLFLAGLVTSGGFAEEIGLIDTDVITQKYTRCIRNNEDMKKSVEQAKSDMALTEEGLQKIGRIIDTSMKEAKNPVNTEAERAKRKAEAEAQMQEFEQLRGKIIQQRQQISETLAKIQQEKNAAVLADVRIQAAIVAKEKGLKIVISKNATLFADASIEISEDVLKRLNQAYIPTAAAATGVTAPAVVAPATTPVSEAATTTGK